MQSRPEPKTYRWKIRGNPIKLARRTAGERLPKAFPVDCFCKQRERKILQAKGLIMEIWTTRSGYEAGIVMNNRGQWQANTRRIGEEDWIEIGNHYSTMESAREAAERLAENYNNDPEIKKMFTRRADEGDDRPAVD